MFAYNRWSTHIPDRANSKIVKGASVRITDVPRDYHEVVRVETRGADSVTVTEERIWVHRPFESRIETWKEGKRLSVRQSRFGQLASRSIGAGAPLEIAVQPSLASGDTRIDSAIGRSLATHFATKREVREVYGRRCQVYRFGGPTSAGDLTKYDPKKDTYADTCVDEHGIVLEEYWLDKGRLLRRRAVTELDVGKRAKTSLFKITIKSTPGINRGLVAKMHEPVKQSDPPLWSLPKAPKGFKRLGRYAVVLSNQAVPQQSQVPNTTPAAASTTDVYESGPDMIAVDQDPGLASLAGMENRPKQKVKAGKLIDAELIVDGRMSEVRGNTPDGQFVRIFGTVDPKLLIRLAGELRPES